MYTYRDIKNHNVWPCDGKGAGERASWGIGRGCLHHLLPHYSLLWPQSYCSQLK